MKLLGILCLLLVACESKIAAKSSAKSRIAGLKRAVTHTANKARKSTFGVSGFKENSRTGTLTVKMMLQPQPVDERITASVQNGDWQPVEEVSPLHEMGFIHWKSVRDGLIFENEREQQTRCQAVAGENTEGKEALVVSFQCNPVDATPEGQPRFKAVSKGKTSAKGVDKKGIWHECSGSVPFGWQTQWGVWDYPYYTVTTAGILGCKTTDADFCTPQNADLFPFTPTFDWSNYIRDPDHIYLKDNGKPLHST